MWVVLLVCLHCADAVYELLLQILKGLCVCVQEETIHNVCQGRYSNVSLHGYSLLVCLTHQWQAAVCCVRGCMHTAAVTHS